eukprot:scaffold43092_cov26-Tisochrysis_lutea.AAC.2
MGAQEGCVSVPARGHEGHVCCCLLPPTYSATILPKLGCMQAQAHIMTRTTHMSARVRKERGVRG